MTACITCCWQEYAAIISLSSLRNGHNSEVSVALSISCFHEFNGFIFGTWPLLSIFKSSGTWTEDTSYHRWSQLRIDFYTIWKRVSTPSQRFFNYGIVLDINIKVSFWVAFTHELCLDDYFAHQNIEGRIEFLSPENVCSKPLDIDPSRCSHKANHLNLTFLLPTLTTIMESVLASANGQVGQEPRIRILTPSWYPYHWGP